MAFFNLDDDLKKFKAASGIAKLARGTLIAGKGIFNLALDAGADTAKKILNNPNSTPEQREKAKEYLDKYKK